MNTEKTLNKVLAVFVSIFLVIAMMFATITSIARSSVSPSGVVGILRDNMHLFEDVGDIRNLDEDSLTALLETDAVKEILNIYAEDIQRNSVGKSSKLDRDKIFDVLMDEKNEIIDAVTDADHSINRQELREEYYQFASDAAVNIAACIPSPESIANELNFNLKGITFVLFGDLMNVVFWVLTVMFAAGVFMLLFTKLRGMKWLGVDAIVCGSPFILFAAVAKLCFTLMDMEMGDFGDIVISAVDSVCLKFAIYGVVFVLIGVALIVGRNYINKLLDNSAARKTAPDEPYTPDYVQNIPVTQPAEVSSAKFDPMTGKPIDAPRFDPMTGERIN